MTTAGAVPPEPAPAAPLTGEPPPAAGSPGDGPDEADGGPSPLCGASEPAATPWAAGHPPRASGSADVASGGVDFDRRPAQPGAHALDEEQRLVEVGRALLELCPLGPLHQRGDFAGDVLHRLGREAVDGRQERQVGVGLTFFVPDRLQTLSIAGQRERDRAPLFSRRAEAGQHAQGRAQGLGGLRSVVRDRNLQRFHAFGREGLEGFQQAPLEVLEPYAHALDDRSDRGGVDADLRAGNLVIRPLGPLAEDAAAPGDSHGRALRQLAELLERPGQLVEGVLFSLDPLPVLDVAEAGVQVIGHLDQQDAPAILALGLDLGRRGRSTRLGPQLLQQFVRQIPYHSSRLR